MSFSIKSDGVLEQVSANLQAMPGWMPAIVQANMERLGTAAVEEMRTAVEPNRYTGALSESILHKAEDGGYSQHIYPTAQRGPYDGGAILESGTRPIPNAPWGPIAGWAAFRGLPAFPVVYKIRTQGVSPHPFLDRTLEATGPHIARAGQDILIEMGARAMHGGGA